MAPQIAEFIDEGIVNIIGGCCGTSPEFIAHYARIAEGKKPHKVVEKPKYMWLSGLDLLQVDDSVHLPVDASRFVNVGERCNVAGSRKFLRLINEKNYEEAIGIARKQVADGAAVVDVNMDDGLLDAKAEMVNFLNMIAAEPDIAKVPVMIDSSKWDVIVAGLKCCQGKCIVNSISLKEGEEVFLSHARDVLRYGAAVVVMCFDEVGQATTFERRIEIAERAYHLLVDKLGMNPLDIIFDPNVLAIATGMEEHDNYAVEFIRATEWIHQNLPGAHVSGGVSNLSFSFRGNTYIREAIHCVFLHHAQQVGMDFGIVNAKARMDYNKIPEEQLQLIEDVVLTSADVNLALIPNIAPDDWPISDAVQAALDDKLDVGAKIPAADVTGLGAVINAAIATNGVTSVNGQQGDVVLGKADVNLGNVANLTPADMPLSTAATAALALKLDASAVGVSVASLVAGKVPASQLPDPAAGRKVVVADQAARLALPVWDDLTIAYQQSDSTTWGLDADANPSVAGNWTLMGSTAVDGVSTFNGRAGVVMPQAGDYTAAQVGADAAGVAASSMATHLAAPDPHPQYATAAEAAAAAPVKSVNGMTGAVTITKASIGLSNVDNTSDANKPVSTLQQAAIAGKVDSANARFTGVQRQKVQLIAGGTGARVLDPNTAAVMVGRFLF
jgi:hypothetical protein